MRAGAPYLSFMLRAHSIAVALLVPMMCIAALPAHAQSKDDPYTIMTPEPGEGNAKPEPWLAPKYQSPRGTKQHVTPPRHVPPPKPPRAARVPPPLVVPGTGRLLPNLPTISPSGPNGTESFQDRAARCAHQAGIYGEAAGNRNAYIGACVNQ